MKIPKKTENIGNEKDHSPELNVMALQESQSQDLGGSLVPLSSKPELRHNKKRDQKRGKIKRSQPRWCLGSGLRSGLTKNCVRSGGSEPWQETRPSSQEQGHHMHFTAKRWWVGNHTFGQRGSDRSDHSNAPAGTGSSSVSEQSSPTPPITRQFSVSYSLLTEVYN